MSRRFLLASGLAVLVCLLTPSLPLRGILLLSGNSTTISSARWLGFAHLEIRGIRYQNAMQIDSLTLPLSPRMLLGRIPEVRIYGARAWLSRLAPAEGSAPRSERGRFPFPLTIQKLFLSESTLLIDNLGPGLPVAPLRLGDSTHHRLPIERKAEA